MWPVSAKAGIKKIRSYQKRKRTINKVKGDDDLELPKLPPTRPQDVWNTAATVRALRDRDPTQFSEPSVLTFYNTIKDVDMQLQKAYLITVEHTALQDKIKHDTKRKSTSRRSIHKGGPSAKVGDLRVSIKTRDEGKKKQKLLRAQKALS